MSLLFFDLNLVVNRVNADVNELANSVYGSVSFQAAISAGAIKRHTAFVLPGQDNAQASRLAGQVVDQQVSATFGVLFAVRNVADAIGFAGNAALYALRNAVLASLLNWVPDVRFDAVNYANGRLQSFANQTLWWQDNYVTKFNIRAI